MAAIWQADDSHKGILATEKFYILIKISPEFVLEDPIDKKPALAWISLPWLSTPKSTIFHSWQYNSRYRLERGN